MVRIARMLTLALTVVSLLLLGAGAATADTVIVPAPAVSYYCPPPVVTYYSPPVVYTPAPAATTYYYGASVSYYTPAVSYYAAPVVSYYAAPAAVTTTTRYGLLGRPRVTTTTYAPPVYVAR